jgi:hypothetical protein
MKSSLLACLLLFSPLIARENPFFSANDSAKNVTSNIPDTAPPLGTLSYNLPDQARVLKEVTFTYQNADGSIETRKIDLDKALDWHKPLLITQGGKSSEIPTNAKSISSAQLQFIQVASTKKELRVTSAAPLMRHFALSNPNRIVLDFKHVKPFDKEEKVLNAAPYTNAVLTHHGTFARAAIMLDGRYDYTLKQSGNTIVLKCK